MSTDWLMVIITAIYVVATIIICFYNAKSARSAKEQTDTTKKQIALMIQQFEEVNRPIVNISFEVIRSGLLCFSIENIGSVAAKDVSIKLCEEFIKRVEENEAQSNIRKLNDVNLYLAPKQRVTIFIAGQSNFAVVSEVIAKIDIIYNNKFEEHTEIDLSKYSYMLLYDGELGDIANSLKKMQEDNRRFQDKVIKKLSFEKRDA